MINNLCYNIKISCCNNVYNLLLTYYVPQNPYQQPTSRQHVASSEDCGAMTVTEISTQELTYYKFHEYNFYIDAQNVHKSLQYYHQRTIDWGRFMVYCKERFQATQVKIFFGYVQKYQTLYNSLRSYGYEICFKETLILPDGTIK